MHFIDKQRFPIHIPPFFYLPTLHPYKNHLSFFSTAKSASNHARFWTVRDLTSITLHNYIRNTTSPTTKIQKATPTYNTFEMPSIKNLLFITFAALAAAQQQADGQITASTSIAPVSQITDGQIQVTTAAPVIPVSQISDGQIQGPTAVSSGLPVPTTNGTTIAPATPSPSAFTGAANLMAWSNMAAAGVVGVAGAALL